jgi:hypothetical protein
MEPLPPCNDRTDATTDPDRIRMWWDPQADRKHRRHLRRGEPDAGGRARVRIVIIGMPGH